MMLLAPWYPACVARAGTKSQCGARKGNLRRPAMSLLFDTKQSQIVGSVYLPWTLGIAVPSDGAKLPRKLLGIVFFQPAPRKGLHITLNLHIGNWQ